jgi:cobalt/nickel transport system ATP-binding protein
MHLIETRDLCYSYTKNGRPALDHINFEARRNQCIAVIGSNGAGKSTLFKMFNGIFTPTSGEVLIKGEPIARKNIQNVRKFVGIVFQNPDDQIISPTVEQDVAFGPMNLGLDDETVRHRVDEALRLLDIQELRDRVPHHLSGGEKKRVAIAGILAMEPEVLVLDEPTAGLDPRGIHDLIGYVKHLSKTYGLTVIFSTHDVGLIPEIADYVYVMNQGTFVKEGTIEEVFSDPELLQSVRLDVPVIPRLFSDLKREGVPVPMAYTYDEALRTIRKTFHGAP